VDAHGGWLFKHIGDGVCAAVASPRAAVDAAVDAQRALELPVRMGIATGEAELRGDDYFGAVLNRAARVMAAGHGGQIMLDGATAELLSGIDFIEMGHRRLRDIAKSVANPTSGLSCAATSSREDQGLMPLPAHSWLWG
jgi:class 3 adenylate cyclase